MQPYASSVAGTHFAMHPDDYKWVNAFCRLPTWENVHFAGGEELPVWVQDPMQRAELLMAAVASMAGEHLTPTQQLELQNLLEKYADIFNPDVTFHTRLGLMVVGLSALLGLYL